MTVAIAASSTDTGVVNKLSSMFIRSRDARRSRYDRWMRNYRLVNNQMGTTGVSSWMPGPRDSEIYPTLSSLIAWMTDNNTMVDCIPAADPHSDYYNYASNIANDLTNILYTNWQVEDYIAQEKMMLWDAVMYGVGIFKCIWDGDKDGGKGNAMMLRVDPWSFYVDPDATSLDDMEYCCEVRRMSYDEYERRYPKAAGVEPSGSPTLPFDEKPNQNGQAQSQGGQPYANAGQLPTSGTYGSLGASGVGNFGRPTSAPNYRSKEGTVVVYEFWCRENEEWTDDYSDIPKADRPEPETHVASRWRVLVMCQGKIVMDEYADDLWSHASHPYERFVFDDIGEFYGIALVDHLAYPQIYINRLLTMVQFNAELIGNPIFIEPANSGTARTPIINKPGSRLQVTGAAGMANPPAWLNPPQMPPFIMDLVNFWIMRIENTSGLSAITKGGAPAQRNAEGVIQSVQEAAFVRIRSALQNLEKTLERAAYKVADLIIDNFNEPRIMAIVGPDGNKTALALFAKHFWTPGRDGSEPLKYMIQCRAGASLPTSRQARIAEADKLYAMGTIDDQALLEAHQYPHIPEILQRKYQKIMQGLFNPPGARQRT